MEYILLLCTTKQMAYCKTKKNTLRTTCTPAKITNDAYNFNLQNTKTLKKTVKTINNKPILLILGTVRI